jgi:anti-sigma regulatory factor (Ser/Thr protein kinase)
VVEYDASREGVHVRASQQHASQPGSPFGGATVTLPAVTESVPAARRFVMKALQDMDAADVCNDVVALVSEVATNAVIHARTPFTIVVRREDDTVRVRVHDRSSVLPRRRAYGLDATTGRGLRLVDTLSSAWGVEAEGHGKVVWFDLACNDDRTPLGWYADVDVDALLDAFDDSDLVGSSRTAAEESNGGRRRSAR